MQGLRADEFNAALLCGQEQHKVDELRATLDDTITALHNVLHLAHPLYHQARHARFIRILSMRAERQWRQVLVAFGILLRRLRHLEELTRRVAAEGRIVGREPYVVHEDRRWVMNGYFELDRSLNPRASVRDRFEGSVLSLFG
jgi:hypothetical protein